ncbi:hypothetical protein Bca4012_077528 [Brassica carinata]
MAMKQASKSPKQWRFQLSISSTTPIHHPMKTSATLKSLTDLRTNPWKTNRPSRKSPLQQCRSRFYSRVYYVFERAKLIGYDKAKELDERGKALFLKDLEACKEMCELIASAITAMKSTRYCGRRCNAGVPFKGHVLIRCKMIHTSMAYQIQNVNHQHNQLQSLSHLFKNKATKETENHRKAGDWQRAHGQARSSANGIRAVATSIEIRIRKNKRILRKITRFTTYQTKHKCCPAGDIVK